MQSLNCGVPQGSLLGPLLFLIYINDIQNCSRLLSFILFADDSNIFLSDPDPNFLLRTANTELIKISQWIKANKLSINLQKTKFMLFSNSVSNLPGDLIIDGTILDKVTSTKFLGITIDEKLSWKNHIDNICKTISRNIGTINKLKYLFPSSTLLMLYSTLILPYLNYGILAWGNASKSQLGRLYLLQKKIVRIISKKGFYSHTNPIFYANKILKVDDLFYFQLGQFMYKYNTKELPNILFYLFTKNSSIHNYPMRHSDSFHIPLTRTVFANKIFTFTGTKFWNSLDDSFKVPQSLHSFKQKLKNMFLSKYFSPQH